MGMLRRQLEWWHQPQGYDGCMGSWAQVYDDVVETSAYSSEATLCLYCACVPFHLSALGRVHWEIGLGTSVHRQHMTWRVNLSKALQRRIWKTNSSPVARKKVRCALRDRREFECGIKYVNHSWVGRCGDDALFVTSWRLDVLALAQAKMGSRPKNLSRRFWLLFLPTLHYPLLSPIDS